MKIKKVTNHRRIVAWLLLATLSPIAMVKTFHYHEIDLTVVSVKGNVVSYHSCCDCPICHFLFSSFILTERFFFEVFELYYCRIVSKVISIINLKFHFSYVLRAPPIL